MSKLDIKYVVIAKHTSHYPNPIQLTPGDLLTLGRKDDEYPGWIWVSTPSGNAGWAPQENCQAQHQTIKETDSC